MAGIENTVFTGSPSGGITSIDDLKAEIDDKDFRVKGIKKAIGDFAVHRNIDLLTTTLQRKFGIDDPEKMQLIINDAIKQVDIVKPFEDEVLKTGGVELTEDEISEGDARTLDDGGTTRDIERQMILEKAMMRKDKEI